MKITIIGTTSYQGKMKRHKKLQMKQGHEVKIPAFDNHPELDDLGVCLHNLEKIKGADEVHMFWDQRSVGTVFDFGMCFALNKPLKIFYMEEKTFRGVMEKYANKQSSGAWYYRPDRKREQKFPGYLMQFVNKVWVN